MSDDKPETPATPADATSPETEPALTPEPVLTPEPALTPEPGVVEHEDAMSPEAIARRVEALGAEDDAERIARMEEEKLAERRAKTKAGKKRSGLEAAASKKLASIGNKPPPRRTVASAADADPLLRRTNELGKWAKDHQPLVVGAGIALVAALIGFGGYTWWQQSRETNASAELTRAIADERGRIGDPDKEEDPDRPHDPRPVFKTEADRRDAALAKFRDIESKYKGTGAAYLSRLQEGSLLLDKHDVDGALAAFNDSKASPLAQADVEVRGRALEGIGFAHELKAAADPASAPAQLEEAIKSFRELENTDVAGFKELGMYHQARAYELKGDKDKAKELLKSLHERLTKPGENHPFPYLEQVADDRLRALDPSALPAKPSGPMGPMGSGAGGQPKMNEAQMKALIEQLKKQQSEKAPAEPAPEQK